MKTSITCILIFVLIAVFMFLIPQKVSLRESTDALPVAIHLENGWSEPDDSAVCLAVPTSLKAIGVPFVYYIKPEPCGVASINKLAAALNSATAAVLAGITILLYRCHKGSKI